VFKKLSRIFGGLQNPRSIHDLWIQPVDEAIKDADNAAYPEKLKNLKTSLSKPPIWMFITWPLTPAQGQFGPETGRKVKKKSN
jgi:hypothetical protein